jgi:hypothetical protein
MTSADSQNLKARVRASENCFSANRIFIIFNHAILTDAIKRKLAPEKRRPNVRASKGRLICGPCINTKREIET